MALKNFDIITHSLSYLHTSVWNINFQTRKLDGMTYIYSHSSQRYSYHQCHEFDWFVWLYYFLVWADVSSSCLNIGWVFRRKERKKPLKISDGSRENKAVKIGYQLFIQLTNFHDCIIMMFCHSTFNDVFGIRIKNIKVLINFRRRLLFVIW